MHCAGIPFVIVNSLCGALVAYGLAGLRLTAHALIINLCITALQSMISIQLQARCRPVSPPCCNAGLHQPEPARECWHLAHQRTASDPQILIVLCSPQCTGRMWQ